MAQFGVQVGGWLIRQDNGWVVDEGPGNGYPLQLSTRNLIGWKITAMIYPESFQQGIYSVSTLSRGVAHGQQGQGDIFLHG